MRRPTRTGLLLLISMGLSAGAGCSSGGPAGTGEAEAPPPAHCTALSGDPLPSMCSPEGDIPEGGIPEGGIPAGGAPAGIAGRSVGFGASPHVPGRTGDPVPVPVRAEDPVPVRVGDGVEPVSPELMPEAPGSGWGQVDPIMPEPGTWQEAEFTDEPPVVREHGTAGPPAGECPITADPGDGTAGPPAAGEPVTPVDAGSPEAPRPSPGAPEPAATEPAPVAAVLDA